MPIYKKSGTVKRKRAPIIEEGSGNVFKDIGFSDAEAANLIARAELMFQIREIIKEKGWTQREAAKFLRVGQPRVAEIMSMDPNYFSVDLLLKYLDKLGKRVDFVFRDKGVA